MFNYGYQPIYPCRKPVSIWEMNNNMLSYFLRVSVYNILMFAGSDNDIQMRYFLNTHMPWI